MKNVTTALGTLLVGMGSHPELGQTDMLGLLAPGCVMDKESKDLVLGVLQVRGEGVTKKESERRARKLSNTKKRLVDEIIGPNPSTRHLPPRIAGAYEALLAPSGRLAERVDVDDPIVMEALYEALGALELEGVDALAHQELISDFCAAYEEEYPDDGKLPSAEGRLRECFERCDELADNNDRCREALRVSLMAALVGPEGVELCWRSGDVRGMGSLTTIGNLVEELRYHFWNGKEDGEDRSQMYRYLTGLWKTGGSQISRILNLEHVDGWRWGWEGRTGGLVRQRKRLDVVEIVKHAIDSGRVSGRLVEDFAKLLTENGKLQRTVKDHAHPVIMEGVYLALDYRNNSGRDFCLLDLVDTVREAMAASGGAGDATVPFQALLDEDGALIAGHTEYDHEVIDAMHMLLLRLMDKDRRARAGEGDLMGVVRSYVKKKEEKGKGKKFAVVGKVAQAFNNLTEEDGTLKEGRSSYDPAVAEAAFLALDYELNRVVRHAPWMPPQLSISGGELFLEPIYQAYAREYATSKEEMDKLVRDMRSAVVECTMISEGYRRTCAIARTLVMAALFGSSGLAYCACHGSTVRFVAAGMRKATVGLSLTQLYGENREFFVGPVRAYGVDRVVSIGRGLEGPDAFSPVGRDGEPLGAVGRHHADLVPQIEGYDVSWYLCPREAKFGTAVRQAGMGVRAVRSGERVKLNAGDEIWLAPQKSGGALLQDYLQGAVLIVEEIQSYLYSRKANAERLPAEQEAGPTRVDEGLPRTQRAKVIGPVADGVGNPEDAIGFSLLVEGQPKADVFKFDGLPVHHELNMSWAGLSIGRDKGGVDVLVGLYNPVVGRQHGRIMHENGFVFYEDYSTNGSRIVREEDPANPRILPVRGKRIALRHNDIICLPDAHVADVRIRFRFVNEHPAIAEYRV